MNFSLDERLVADTFVIGDMALSRLLLMNDARWPWLILAPRREGVVELTDLDSVDRARLIEEAARAADFLKRHTNARKINLGALGNVVRQFHLHVVARTIDDAAWPGPVWGLGAARRYAEADALALIEAVKNGLELQGGSGAIERRRIAVDSQSEVIYEVAQKFGRAGGFEAGRHSKQT